MEETVEGENRSASVTEGSEGLRDLLHLCVCVLMVHPTPVTR